MKRIAIFSQPTEANRNKLTEVLFPKELGNFRMAYMPSNGHNTNQIYTDYWHDFASENKAEFKIVDNMLPEESGEAEKIEWANILLISGGNTFELLNNLRTSKLDRTVKEFTKKEMFVLSGFSAGAIVLSPTITTATLPSGDDESDLVDANLVGITDLTGLNLIDFDVMPHYVESKDFKTVEGFRRSVTNKVVTMTNDEVVTLDLD